MELHFMNHSITRNVRAVPAHLIHAVLRAMLLDHYPDRVGEADRVVGHVGGEEEHGAFGDGEGAGDAVVDDFEEERAAVLEEPFGGCVDV
ncbi:hypothetical protein V494_08323, partial [Pseudogymnoascus sp. VKM F-4513 (FW-928)]